MPPLRAAIQEAKALALRLGRVDLHEDLDEIEARLARRVLSVALIGQFKRGKTSLLNALIGEEILPTGVLPLTAIVTHVRWGKEFRAVVRLQDGSELEVPQEEIHLYATELGNPKNARGVKDILIYYPAGVLAEGIELVDTPGIGSVWAHNTDVATGYLPWVDVALFVVSPDPPITDLERQFLEDARAHAGKVLVVLTKSDLLSEADLEIVRRFIAQVAETALGVSVPVLRASVLQGRQTGLQQIADRLLELRRSEGESVAAAMARRRVLGVLNRLIFDFRLQRAALMTPQELRAQRHATLRGYLFDFQDALAMYKGAWQSAFRGVTQAYDARLEALKRRLLDALRLNLGERLQAMEHPRNTYLETADALTGLARTRLEVLRDDMRRMAPEILEDAARPLVGQIQSWTSRFAQAAADLFELPAVTLDLPLEIKESRGFSFKWRDDPGLLPTLTVPPAVTLLPHQRAIGAAKHSLEAQMVEFVDRNVGRLHYHFHESMKQQWRDLWRRIEEVLQRLEHSLGQAAATLADDDPSTTQRLAAIDATLGEVARIEGVLGVDEAAPSPH